MFVVWYIQRTNVSTSLIVFACSSACIAFSISWWCGAVSFRCADLYICVVVDKWNYVDVDYTYVLLCVWYWPWLWFKTRHDRWLKNAHTHTHTYIWHFGFIPFGMLCLYILLLCPVISFLRLNCAQHQPVNQLTNQLNWLPLQTKTVYRREGEEEGGGRYHDTYKINQYINTKSRNKTKTPKTIIITSKEIIVIITIIKNCM